VALREARGNRYPDDGVRLKASPCGQVITFLHPVAPALFPAASSDAIVVGEVSRLQTYQTPKRTHLFTEFSVSVRELLKRSPADEVGAGRTVLVERLGGVLRLPSGRLLMDRPQERGLPQLRHRYVMFLKRNPEGDYSIITAYDLTRSTIVPLDVTREPITDSLKTSPKRFLEAVKKAALEQP
jgi:hypothetical protein